MPDKTITTQEGEVQIGASAAAPTVVGPDPNVAYSSAYEGRMALERAQQLATEAREIFRGEDWSELPNFYCPLCSYATLDGDVVVFSHGAARHPGIDLKELVKHG